MKFGELEIGTRLQSVTSRARTGVVLGSVGGYVVVEWSDRHGVYADSYPSGCYCNCPIAKPDPVTFGELEVGDVVGYGPTEETVVYKNDHRTVLDDWAGDIVSFLGSTKIKAFSRTFIRRGIK